MVHKELLKDLQVLGEKIIEALGKDKQRNTKSRDAKYKAKRIAEASSLWDEYNKKLIELQAALEDDDPCVKEATDKYADAYKKYTDRLLKIPSIQSTAQNVTNVDTESDDDDEEETLIKVQYNRFNTIKRILSDVKLKRDHDIVPTSAYITIKKQRIIEMWSKIQNYDELISNNDIEYKTEVCRLEEAVDEVLIFLQDSLAQSDMNNTPSEGLKLNRVDIPKFSGDYFKWMSFRDLFEEMVIKNKKLPKAHKMQLLKTHVIGEAETLISDLTVSETNFDSAWQRLMSRYNNNRVVVYKMITKLMNQASSKGDAKSIKKILDTTDQMLLSLQNMKRPTKTWDDWIVVLITQKLSEDTHKDWERKIGNSAELPTWDQLKAFLGEQFRMLERLEGNNNNNNKRNEYKNFEKSKQPLKAFQTSVELSCVLCEESHTLYACPKWKSMSPKDRQSVVKKQKWCKRCLREHQDKQKCEKVCKKCGKGHSTWLHENRAESENTMTAAHGTFATVPYKVLLATAMVKIYDNQGQAVLLRVLIDSASEGSLITEAAALRLNVKAVKSDRWIQGLVGNKSEPLKKIHVTIQPRFESSFSLNIDLYILKTLTKMLPGHDISVSSWKHIQKLNWADPKFNKRGPIDALLGMDTIVDLFKPGFIKGIAGQPMAQETELGWVMSGKIDPTFPANEVKCLVSTLAEETTDLRKFWEIEELHPIRTLTKHEIECEEFFKATVRQHENGQFIVNIPFKQGADGPERLGESKCQAIARFLQIEKKLARDPDLGNEYKRVIQEYINLGHMKEVTDAPKQDKKYYIPHHAVIKMDKLTTKVRVVFDASAKTTTGWSLNECMHTGAKQQRDLADILINWRIHKVVYKADIEKMYRMIQLNPEDQKFHTVVWRDSSTEPLKEYQLTTTTFGTAAAPFLATRTLIQIADEQKDTYPLAAACLNNDFYVDDLIGGSNDLDGANKTKNELVAVLEKHQLHLRKWTSNCPELLNTLAPEMTEKSLQLFANDDTSKALGLLWSPQTDQFSFKVNWIEANQTNWTKRQFLAESSKLFDPLGWLAPITINAKIMMQEIWMSKIGWDVLIPQNIGDKWAQFRQEFKKLESIRIDRWMGFETGSEISLHGFSDASEQAYSAQIYARVRVQHETWVRLITAKTRVAPIQSKVSLPRLELCGAVLVSNLMSTVVKALHLDNAPTYLWADSMITLGWIHGQPNKWKTFVANRVSEIRSNSHHKWNYVPTDQNPADCASRGLMPLELIDHPLWWTGPTWLKEEPEYWPNVEIQDHNLEQRKTIAVNLVQMTTNDTVSQLSSWYKLKRIAAYCRRFITKKSGPLSVAELQAAENGIIRKCQEESFLHEIQNLIDNQPFAKKSKLKSLNVFLDEEGILRLGGRLTNAQIPYGRKHPIVLPAGHHITKIIIHQMHLDTYHGGPKLMKGLLMNKYWIIQSKRMVHNEFSKCLICRKFKGEAYKQQMGELPKARVTLDRAFKFSGVDYAGPIEVKSSNFRSARIQKGYVAVYVCMGTKAVHLELVSDETTEAFLASFERFTARRGLPTAMYSDNGSNFEGADNQLQRNYWHQQNQEIAKVMVNKQVEWNFIPPGAPNFGGLWEKGVRSMKDHLKKTLRTARLTFEEYATLLCQV